MCAVAAPPTLVRQSQRIEENNRMRKTRDLFKKIRDTKGRVGVRIRVRVSPNHWGPRHLVVRRVVKGRAGAWRWRECQNVHPENRLTAFRSSVHD